ncbi:MAG: type 1 glutamine amidotransferase domain-containing protein [Ktedonobacterales bacterium]
MTDVKNLRVAVIATNGFEEQELTEPVKALRDAGAEVTIFSDHAGPIQAFKHHDKSITVQADGQIDQANPMEFDALLLPGGALNADTLRINPNVQAFIKAMDSDGKPMAVICHASWELISAGAIKGRTLTSYKTIQDDVRNAGAHWVDREVVVDGNLVTSRQPDDIPAFNREMLALFSRRPTTALR